MTYGITATGFSKPALSDIKSDIEKDLTTAFGPETNVIPPSVFATITGIFSERESNLWDLGQGIYDSQYPDTAVGVPLDNVVAINGIRRLPATYSTQRQILLFGQTGTVVPKGTKFSVKNVPTSQFATDADSAALVDGVDEVQTILFSATPNNGSYALSLFGQVTALINYNANAAAVAAALNALPALGGGVTAISILGGFEITFGGVDGKQPQPLLEIVSNTLVNGSNPVGVTPAITTQGVAQAIVTATATSLGAHQAPALSLTVIDTPVAGLDLVLNYLDANAGREVETDQELRIRRSNTLQIAGNATIDAIRSKLLNLIGVTSVVPFENQTDLPDVDSRPPHSYEMAVAGGVDQQITQTIWDTKPAGIRTDGNQTGIAIDRAGNNQTVHWSRPIARDVYCIVEILKNSDYPADGDTVIEEDILNYGHTLGVGESVYVKTKLIGSFSVVDGIVDVTVKLSTSPGPTIEQNLIAAANEQFIFDSSRITVNSV